MTKHRLFYDKVHFGMTKLDSDSKRIRRTDGEEYRTGVQNHIYCTLVVE